MKTVYPRCLTAICCLLSLSACNEPYNNPRNTPEVRASDLVGLLTLPEKVALMQNASPAIPRLNIKAYDWWNEALHGVGRAGLATVFPQAIGMGASFNDSLLHEVFTAVSDEARAKSNRFAREQGELKRYQGLTFWTPNVNIFRDPRWGRGQETSGEDPYLTGRMGVAVVRGLQGPEESAYDKLHACAKHFAVHSGPEWNRHSFDVEQLPARDLYETYLPAFKELVQKAHVKEVMCAYNRFEGEPCCGSNRLLTHILRQEWGFDGIILSDCGAIDDFYRRGHHEVAPDSAHASAAAVQSGTDLECGQSYRSLLQAVEEKLISERTLNQSLHRLLKARFELGEMDHEGVEWQQIPYEVVDSDEHQQLALKMAQESLVLLQNRNNLLPLAPEAKGIVVMGPNATDSVMQWGNYNGTPSHTVTLLEGIRAYLPEVPYVKGCDLTADTLNLPEILRRVRTARIILFAGGISPRLEGEEMPVDVPGFRGGDRERIELPAVQTRLLKALQKAGKKVVLINFSGSAVALTPEAESCEAILQAWYPGQAGGTAIANVLFGAYNPAGRLPVTFYKSTDQLPDYQSYAMQGRTYRYFEGEPLFPFGHGLSYTTFEYAAPRTDAPALVVTDSVPATLAIEVTNTGACDGQEVVQLYLSKPDDVAAPSHTLRWFCRLPLKSRTGRTVSLTLHKSFFEWWDESTNTMRPLSGSYRLLYGGSSDRNQLQSIPVTVK
jgi:beta-glucosidase